MAKLVDIGSIATDFETHRSRERTLGNNRSLLHRFAVTLLKRHLAQVSISDKMLSCGYSTAMLEEGLVIKDN